MSGVQIRAGGGPAKVLVGLYRMEKAGRFPKYRFDKSQDAPFRRLLELDYVRWPAGGTGTLTEAGRIAARALEAGS